MTNKVILQSPFLGNTTHLTPAWSGVADEEGEEDEVRRRHDDDDDKYDFLSLIGMRTEAAAEFGDAEEEGGDAERNDCRRLNDDGRSSWRPRPPPPIRRTRRRLRCACR